MIQKYTNVKGDIFYLLDYVTRRSEKLRFQKKKKKKNQVWILPDITVIIVFLASSKIIEKIIILKNHSALVNFVKLR